MRSVGAWKRTLTFPLSLEGRGDPFVRSLFHLLHHANRATTRRYLYIRSGSTSCLAHNCFAAEICRRKKKHLL